MPTTEPFDAAALAALAQTVTRTVQDEEGKVKVTARPKGEIAEITVSQDLYDLGHQTAAAEILSVIKAAQDSAEAEYKQMVQSRFMAAMQHLEGEQK